MYLSTVANRQGEIAKQLTIIATIFLPLTFLTGFFGQNFAFLTGHIQDSTWSFCARNRVAGRRDRSAFFFYFRRKRWVYGGLGAAPRRRPRRAPDHRAAAPADHPKLPAVEAENWR